MLLLGYYDWLLLGQLWKRILIYDVKNSLTPTRVINPIVRGRIPLLLVT